MQCLKGMKKFGLVASLFILIAPFAFADDSDSKIEPVISAKIFEKAKKNNHWKYAFVTGKDAQVVFMNVTPTTNPKNEIGIETHKFDQVIFVVEGKAKAMLNGKESIVTAGDMIYVPQGTPHNFINLNAKNPFKIISIYSDTDIPAGADYQKKSDAP